ncbi:flagellar assembly protein FliW [Lysinibacillus sphaericus]|uniref:Flagellar assembly factor FliW n=1 Tax=Lysinibacillus sphaericus OT4b.31 TaxID=1285586 RepID=R7Z8Y7_LYSSH|nr:flagellar assembly protein FliW [Lysinibacillus sphaericus]EON70431.1 flagellar assembly factor fliW [Lysinibacillus sphaericus OT4b.31]
MKIATKFLGEVEITNEDVITFPEGIPGFPDVTKFVLLPLDQDLPLALLQATESAELGFIVAYPFVFKPDYAFDLSMEDSEVLVAEREEDLVTYAIVTLKEKLSESTMNLLAPVVISMKKKVGKQIVLSDSKAYPLRFSLSALEGSVK